MWRRRSAAGNDRVGRLIYRQSRIQLSQQLLRTHIRTGADVGESTAVTKVAHRHR